MDIIIEVITNYLFLNWHNYKLLLDILNIWSFYIMVFFTEVEIMLGQIHRTPTNYLILNIQKMSVKYSD